MRRLTPATWFLILFWTLYGLAVTLKLYQAEPSVNRDLVFIIGSYAAVMAVVSGAILFRATLWRLFHKYSR